MKMNRRRNRRLGATTLEMSIVLGMMVLMCIGTLDLGLAVFRHHVVATAARQGARRAIVHGSMANVLGVWGPTAISTTASASGVPIVDGARDGIKNLLVGCDPAQTQIQVQWIDGGNDVDQRVRVTVSSPYSPILTAFFTNHTLTASSTMPIAH